MKMNMNKKIKINLQALQKEMEFVKKIWFNRKENKYRWSGIELVEYTKHV